MFYINSIKQNNNYGNPMGQYFKDSIQLPDELLNEYLKTKGFCNFEIQNNIITKIIVNQNDLDDYNNNHPEVKPEPSAEQDINAMLIDQEYRITLLELGMKGDS